jgi:hypothetical protein
VTRLDVRSRNDGTLESVTLPVMVANVELRKGGTRQEAQQEQENSDFPKTVERDIFSQNCGREGLDP